MSLPLCSSCLPPAPKGSFFFRLGGSCGGSFLLGRWSWRSWGTCALVRLAFWAYCYMEFFLSRLHHNFCGVGVFPTHHGWGCHRSAPIKRFSAMSCSVG